MRFRRSIRIAKGFRVNLSKSGASISTGVRGLSMTFGSRGTYLNTGIPGTGLYNRQRIGPGRTRRGGDSSVSSTPGQNQGYISIKVGLDDAGKPVISDSDENPIQDESLLRKIKRSPEFKAKIAELQERKRQEIEQATDKFVDLFRSTPALIEETAVREQLEQLKPNEYQKQEFSTPRPDQERIRADVETEARKTIRSALFWKNKELRRHFVDERVPNRVAAELRAWQSEKTAFQREERLRKEQKDAEYLQVYNQQKSELEGKLSGSQGYVDQQIEDFFGGIALPMDFSVQFEYSQLQTKVDLDLDLPEIEDMPSEKARTLSSGKLSIKKKTAKELQEDYARCVIGLAFFFAGHIFNFSPAIRQINIAGYTQRTNRSTGHVEDEYVYSVMFDRERFRALLVPQIDPIEAIRGFEHRMNINSSFQLKTIEPL